jgi:hypothetical protein
MSFLKFAIKSAFWSTVIIGSGYAIMISVVPNEDQLRAEINKHRELRGQEPLSVDKKVDGINKVFKKQMEAIRENANSGRPVWDVKL